MRNFLVKQSYDCIWHFTHTDKNGICFSKMKDEQVTEYEVLLNGARSDFDVTIDNQNCIHLVCQDEKGNIYYLNNPGDNWHKSLVLQSKTETKYDKNLRIICTGEIISIFYIIEHNDRKMLAHQALNGTPAAIDYISGEYKLVNDAQSGLWLIYYAEKDAVLGYRRYLQQKNEWSDHFRLTDEQFEQYDVLIVDDKPIITAEKNGKILAVEDEKSRIIDNGASPILFLHNKALWCLYLSDKAVKAQKSTDNGVTWLSSGNIITGRTAQPILFNLRYTNLEKEIFADKCYGYSSNNIAHLYILNRFFLINRVPPQTTKVQKDTHTDKSENLAEIELSRFKTQTADLLVLLGEINHKIDRMDQALDVIIDLLNKPIK